MNGNCFTLGLLRQKIKAFSAEAEGKKEGRELWLRERQPWTSPEVRQKKVFFLAFLFFAKSICFWTIGVVILGYGKCFSLDDDGDINRTQWSTPPTVLKYTWRKLVPFCKIEETLYLLMCAQNLPSYRVSFLKWYNYCGIHYSKCLQLGDIIEIDIFWMVHG